MKTNAQPATSGQPAGSNWYEIKETHNSFGLQIMFLLIRFLPAVFLRLLAFPVGFCYFLFAKKARAVSKQYQERIQAVKAAEGEKFRISTLKHIVSFALVLTEKVSVWAGKFALKNISFEGNDALELQEHLSQKKGCLLIISHLGNSELLRALVDHQKTGLSEQVTVHVVYDKEISGGFVALLNKIDAHATFNLIDANNITPQTITFMQERLAAGECIAIAGDRTSAHTNRFLTVPFLGKNAHFSYGTFLLAALLDVPTWFIFGMRRKDTSLQSAYTMSAYKNQVSFDCSRKEREERMLLTAQAFAHELETRALEHPYQWYNFFDFWTGASQQS
ncbi:MAG: hypothetical protein K6G80_03450 [Treponema sp.]|nr:hypothetical protein [Treponema sp.]